MWRGMRQTVALRYTKRAPDTTQGIADFGKMLFFPEKTSDFQKKSALEK
jgi:hypothetical protein